MFKKVLNIMVLALLFGVGSLALAGSSDMEKFKCGAKAIELGMSTNDIKTSCGSNWKPSYISKHKRAAVGSKKSGEQAQDHFEKWMYSTSGKSDTHIILKNDEVIRIFTVVQQ